MSRSLPLLRKKLHELENVLADAFRSSLLDPTATDPDRFHDGFNKRFLFLQKLLSAELSSHPEASDQLCEIEQRLVRLKVAFRDWSLLPKTTELIPRNDALSVCSGCTQALLCDEDVHECDDPPIAKESFCCEKSLEKCSDADEEEESAMEEAAGKMERRNRGGIWKYYGAFACGVIIGAICVVECFSFSLPFEEHEAFVAPPT